MKELNLIEIFQILKKYMLSIILTVLIVTGIAYGITQILPEKYESYTTILLSNSKTLDNTSEESRITDINLNQKLVGTYSELIKSRTIVEEVIKNLGLNYSYKEFRDKLDVKQINNTEIIKITVTDTNSLRAKDIANETAEVFSRIIVNLIKHDNVNIIDFAIEANKPVSPSISMNLLLGAVAGLLFGIIIAFIRELFDNTIKTDEEIAKYLELTIIGNIPIEPKGD